MTSSWREVYKRFDPEATDDRPEWFVDRPRSPVADILADLDAELDVLGAHVLLTGTVGTGKSTELLKLAHARSAKNFVVLVDLVAHFNRVIEDDAALHHIAPWEVCFLAGLQVLRAAEEQLDFIPASAGYKELADAWTRAATATKTESVPEASVDLAKLAKGLVVTASAIALPSAGSLIGGGLKLLEATADSTSSKRSWIPFARSMLPRSDQTEELKSMLTLVNRIVTDIAQRGRPVLLVIDGLDRITSEAQAKALFVDSTLLSRLACNVVITGPFALRHRPELAQVRGFRPRVLVNEPVLQKSDPMKRGDGIDFFLQLFRRRTADIAGLQPLSDEQLSRLAYYSGGRAREFVALVRLAARQAVLAHRADVSDAMIDKALDERRRLREQGLNEQHVELLARVAASKDRLLPKDEPSTWMLIDSERLLPYPNDSEWYFPHPLLFKLLGLRRALD
jgi:type II secretory pathway predicted ATPase ExeA